MTLSLFLRSASGLNCIVERSFIPLATPKSTLPNVILSSIATSSATRIGCQSGKTIGAVPTRNFSQ